MEASNQSYRYELEILSQAGQTVAQVPLDANWEPAVECALFAAQLASPGHGLEGRMTWSIAPVPDSVLGLPYCQGFRVELEVAGTVAGDQFPLTYFREIAQAMAAGFVSQGRLKAGENFLYKLLARPESGPASARSVSGVAERQLFPLPVRERHEVLPPVSSDVMTDPHDSMDVPVEIPQQVVDEADALTLEAGAAECGGVLIGHLVRDGGDGGLRVVVTAQIPAEQTESELTSLVFTPATWAAARGVLRERNRQEMMIGWWHSHPARFWCSPECPPEKRAVCPLADAQIFSAMDRQFHNSLFPKAFTIAWVVTHTDKGMTHAAYGWRRARLEERAFHLTNINQ